MGAVAGDPKAHLLHNQAMAADHQQTIGEIRFSDEDVDESWKLFYFCRDVLLLIIALGSCTC